MELSPENKQHIDSLSADELLSRWRFSPGGDEWFQGATGEYWARRMAEKMNQEPPGAVSKRMGWVR